MAHDRQHDAGQGACGSAAGDEVLLCDPGYPCNRQFVTLFGGVPRSLALRPEQGFRLTAETLASAWTERTRVAMVASPDNPTGNRTDGAALAGLARDCRARGGRVIAVGTTSIRTLESWALTGQVSGDTSIFITPGFEFKVVDALITNFHLPKSTLMMLISALAGHGHVMALYQHAIAQRYRFFSYGDAMLLKR